MRQRDDTDPSRVRRAAEYDLVELIRLRALLFEDLGGDFFNPASADGGWLDALAVVLKEQLTTDTVRVLVVDGPDGTLAACGIGTVEQRLPGPHLRNGRIGQVLGVVTDPSHRRLGHSRAIMRGLLDWFRESGVSRVDLHASAEGEPLYRDLGFTEHPDPSLYWRP
ncbi:GNAT family N-acetyltransferase [Streptomyces sp. NPDC101175]|uniref:GNAT family N-acetyltransferase n=1 Tax=Streptomyces sp. NPDC101175 TaxID=3366123 RepID=UPI003837DBE9